MKEEFRLAQSFAAGSDFYEGVRALLVDKDKKPRWEISSVDKVGPELVDDYFSSKGLELELHDVLH